MLFCELGTIQNDFARILIIREHSVPFGRRLIKSISQNCNHLSFSNVEISFDHQGFVAWGYAFSKPRDLCRVSIPSVHSHAAIICDSFTVDVNLCFIFVMLIVFSDHKLTLIDNAVASESDVLFVTFLKTDFSKNRDGVVDGSLGIHNEMLRRPDLNIFTSLRYFAS